MGQKERKKSFPRNREKPFEKSVPVRIGKKTWGAGAGNPLFLCFLFACWGGKKHEVKPKWGGGGKNLGGVTKKTQTHGTRLTKPAPYKKEKRHQKRGKNWDLWWAEREGESISSTQNKTQKKVSPQKEHNPRGFQNAFFQLESI